MAVMCAVHTEESSDPSDTNNYLTAMRLFAGIKA